MATKKTKNTKNAAEYIDSAGVKLNNNADLIIEANAAGDVVSARNVLTGSEYVGGGSGGGALKATLRGDVDAGTGTITWGNCSHTGVEMAQAIMNGIIPYIIVSMYSSNVLIAELIVYASGIQGGTNEQISFLMIDASSGQPKSFVVMEDGHVVNSN